MENSDRGKNFLEESDGNQSMMRLLSLMSLLFAGVFSFMVIQARDPTRMEFYLIMGFLVGAFAPKVFQKYAESVVKPVASIKPPKGK